METDGGDKDSTDNPGEIHSTQQPEDPSLSALSLCLSTVWACCYCVITFGRFFFCFFLRASSETILGSRPVC